MKCFPALLMVILAAVFSQLGGCNGQHSNESLSGLPWQIEILPDGATRVFGITPGQTSLGKAIEHLGSGMDLAIIAAPGEVGSLEAYYSHYAAGALTGKLILVMAASQDTLLTMRERGTRDGGTRRYYLHPDDLLLAYATPVEYIAFLPGTNLDEEIAQARFGTPAEIVEVSPQQKHLLYPDKGLDLVLDAEGMDLLQYLSPHRFDAHRVRILQAGE
jgi:hypothetical protein